MHLLLDTTLGHIYALPTVHLYYSQYTTYYVNVCIFAWFTSLPSLIFDCLVQTHNSGHKQKGEKTPKLTSLIFANH